MGKPSSKIIGCGFFDLIRLMYGLGDEPITEIEKEG